MKSIAQIPRPLYLLIATVLFASALCAQDINLPSPRTTGGMPVLEALARRSTSRAFDSKELSDQQLSTLLWACFGINRSDGKRTAPSANNKQPTDIYVLLKSGAYLYDAKANKLTLVLPGDIRKLGGTQDFVTNAPATLVFVADLSKMGDANDESKKNTANVNVGYISENAYLFCASERLATGARGSVDRRALSAKLKLRPDQLIILAQSVGYPARPPGTTLPRSTPEAQGISSQAILRFVEAAERINTLHSFMIVRHGHVISEAWWKPEAPDKPHALASLSKSFNATAVGLAIHDGKLSLDDPVLKFFPTEAPPNPSENLKAMKVRDLLTMSCGHDTEPKIVGGAPTVSQFLAHPVVHTPGTHFQYNTLGSYTLSAILTKVTGQTTLEYLKPRLFEPLGIEDPQWDSSPEGNSLGGYGLKLCTEDIAKFGQLYLQKGKWNGKQLVPQLWVEQATSKQVPNDKESHAKMGVDWQQGYGFQFWRCTHNAFRGDGAGGQLCVVLPDQDAVIAITAQTGSFQDEMNAIWDNLLPAFHPEPLPGDSAAQQKLKDAIANLVAHPENKGN